MNVVQRNLFCLIRNGVFDHHDRLEPMSVFKWNQLHQLAVAHGVAKPVYMGLQHSTDQFFFHLTDHQKELWRKTMLELHDETETFDDVFLRADHLTNPVLNRRLQRILDDENSNVNTRKLLLNLISITRHILNEGVPVRQLMELGLLLRKHIDDYDYITLERWLKDLNFWQMAQLEGALLMMMFKIEEKEIPFLQEEKDKNVTQVAQELVDVANTHMVDFSFSQNSDSIFIHTKNSSAMIGHIKRSVQYFRYVPSETITNFFASFARSLAQIEE